MAADVFIAGGGTGGHVYPAIAIADAIVRDGVRMRRTDVHFVGSKRGLEARVVPAAGYTVTLLPGRGLTRSVSVNSAKSIGEFLSAFAKAFWLLARKRPSVVISVGGYAAAPCAFSAILLRIPVVIAESNAVPGLVNKLLGRFAAASAIAWPGTKLPHAVVTGNPVRDVILEVDRSTQRSKDAKRELGFDEDIPLIAVIGGSGGATQINRAIAGLADVWPAEMKASLFHAVGKRDWANPDLHAKSSDYLHAIAVEYAEHMELVYAAADVVVCRSGATTVAELASVGVPSLLIPLPHSPGDHQMANARALERAGAADVLVDSICDPETTQRALSAILIKPDHLLAMGRAAKQFARPDAAHAVADIVRSVLAKSGRAYER